MRTRLNLRRMRHQCPCLLPTSLLCPKLLLRSSPSYHLQTGHNNGSIDHFYPSRSYHSIHLVHHLYSKNDIHHGTSDHLRSKSTHHHGSKDHRCPRHFIHRIQNFNHQRAKNRLRPNHHLREHTILRWIRWMLLRC